MNFMCCMLATKGEVEMMFGPIGSEEEADLIDKALTGAGFEVVVWVLNGTHQIITTLGLDLSYT